MSVITAIEVYKDKREAKEAAERAFDDAKAELQEAERALVEAMVSDEVESIKVDGKLFSLSTKAYYSCPADNSDALFALLRRDGLGDIIKEKVDPRTLSSSLRELAEECGGVLPEGYGDVVNVYDKTSISVRRG